MRLYESIQKHLKEYDDEQETNSYKHFKHVNDKKTCNKEFILSVNGENPVKYNQNDMSVEEAIKDYLENEGSNHTKEDISVEYLDEVCKLKEYDDDFVTKDIPDDKLPVDLAKQGKCPYCAGPMSDEEYKLFGMCENCYDNGAE